MSFSPFPYQDHVTVLDAATMVEITQDVYDQATADAAIAIQDAVAGITGTDKQRLEFGSVAGSLPISFDSKTRVIVAAFSPVGAVFVTTSGLSYGQELWLDISQPSTGGFAVTVPQSVGSFTVPLTAGSQTVAMFASLDGVSLVPTQSATVQTTLQSALSITSSAIQTGT